MNTAKIDLHLHLDGSLNIAWAYQKALQRNVIEKGASFEDFYDLLFSRNLAHSAESIRKFELVCDLLQTYEDLYDSTYDLCRRLNDSGIIYVEIRFASQQHCKQGLSQLDALQAVAALISGCSRLSTTRGSATGRDCRAWFLSQAE